jgi:hypothetical protein
MGWMSRFRGSGRAEPAWTRALSMANGTPSPHNANEAIESGPKNAAAPGDSPDPQIAEGIKRRQISLALRYVVAVRAR